ncbi:MAG: hypothetical protein JXR21_02390 [Candidatus Marinimicrobia bacterium]|nr:hypothetical protein [Candidatus Neomarinimicrobiota bacterium]
MKVPICLCVVLLLIVSCASRPERLTYRLENAPFPHPERADGMIRKGIHYPADEHYSDNSVAVLIPEAYRKGASTDLIVHFHGWGNNIDRCIEQFELKTQLEMSGKNLLMVVPEGPKNAPDSFNGKLCDEGGFRRFVDELLDSLKSDGIVRTRRIGRIILSGHSGGYYVMAHILRYGGYRERISDVFLFDGLYGNEEDYMNWLRKAQGRFVNIYTENGGTKYETERFMSQCDSLGIPYVAAQTKDMAAMPAGRVLMLYSDLKHNEVIAVRKNLLKLLLSMEPWNDPVEP